MISIQFAQFESSRKFMAFQVHIAASYCMMRVNLCSMIQQNEFQLIVDPVPIQSAAKFHLKKLYPAGTDSQTNSSAYLRIQETQSKFFRTRLFAKLWVESCTDYENFISCESNGCILLNRVVMYIHEAILRSQKPQKDKKAEKPLRLVLKIVQTKVHFQNQSL